MDKDQPLLDSEEACDEAQALAKYKLNQFLYAHYENAARYAHECRINHNRVTNLLTSLGNKQILAWNDMSLSSQNHLIAEAKAVAENPSITAEGLFHSYQNRLIMSGDTDNPDLKELNPLDLEREEYVLNDLKIFLVQNLEEQS